MISEVCERCRLVMSSGDFFTGELNILHGCKSGGWPPVKQLFVLV